MEYGRNTLHCTKPTVPLPEVIRQEVELCAVPCSVLLIAVMLAYYIVTAFQVWKWSDRTVNASRVPWPDWAWAMGAGAAVCWFIAAGVASGQTTDAK